MKLQQLRYAVEVFRRNLNISEAADALYTSQPGVSKQIRLLEDELGVQIFVRSGKRLAAVTPAGITVLEKAEQILRCVHSIKQLKHEFSDTQTGILRLATTHHGARYRLPAVLTRFAQTYPDVRLSLRQGSPAQIVDMMRNGEVDLALCQDVPSDVGELKTLPCATWRYGAFVPSSHALCRLPEISLLDLTAYDLLTYPFALQGDSVATRAFHRAQIGEWRTAFESDDAEVLKQYARLGLGVALLDQQAYDATRDADLTLLDIGYLFEPSDEKIILRQEGVLRNYIYDFIEYLSPTLNRERVDKWLFAPAVEDFSI